VSPCLTAYWKPSYFCHTGCIWRHTLLSSIGLLNRLAPKAKQACKYTCLRPPPQSYNIYRVTSTEDKTVDSWTMLTTTVYRTSPYDEDSSTESHQGRARWRCCSLISSFESTMKYPCRTIQEMSMWQRRWRAQSERQRRDWRYGLGSRQTLDRHPSGLLWNYSLRRVRAGSDWQGTCECVKYIGELCFVLNLELLS
jgi:hypothetical protein